MELIFPSEVQRKARNTSKLMASEQYSEAKETARGQKSLEWN